MSNLFGYISSFFVTFGLGIGFVLGGLIFLFLFTYAIMLVFKRSRRALREDLPRPFARIRNQIAKNS